MQTQATQPRGRQAKPTRDEVRRYWRELKARADAGELPAIEAVLRLLAKEHSQ